MLLARMDGVTRKVFADRTGYSEDQYQYWFGAGEKRGAPSVRQASEICQEFDWSPSWIQLGRGPMRLHQLDDVLAVSEAHRMSVENNQMLKQILSALDPSQKTED